MRLGLVMLSNFSTLNNVQYISQSSIAQGSTAEVWFQLVDLDTINETNKRGGRYMPAIGATLSAYMKSVNDANSITKVAAMAFPADDRSIWKFTLSAAETAIMAGVNLKITLTEGANISIANGNNVVSVIPSNQFQC